MRNQFSPSLLSTLLAVFAVATSLKIAAAQTLVSSTTGVHIFYRTGWSAPYIHYNTGSGWTTSPGYAMTASNDTTNFPSALGWFRYDLPSTVTSLEFVFNNGAGTWDNNANANYKVTSGTWQLTSTVSTPPSATVKTYADDGTGLHVYFQTGWTKPYLHYTTGSGWTTSPGVVMSASTSSVYPSSLGWFKYDFASPTASLEFVFNNGAGTWDNNNNANYKATSAGTWIVESNITTTNSTSTTTAPSSTTSAPLTSGTCSNYDGLDACSSSSQTDAPTSDDDRKWQTPPRNSSSWKSEYQDYRSLTGYAHVVYDADRTSATVTVRTYTRTNTSCFYTFNDDVSWSAEFKVTNSLTDGLNITATCTDTSTDEEWVLKLDPVNFVWQSNTVTQPSGMKNGQKGAIVDLFGWPYDDIAKECADFLGKAGYMGVKINPPQESVLTDAWPQSGQRNPWYFVYQPVSYRLYSRMGTRAQLRSMIQTCRANGVRVYADAVVNHMTGAGNDILLHRNGTANSCYSWGAKSSAIESPYFTFSETYGTNDYTGYRAALEYPAVPFSPFDFHCQRSISSWADPVQLQYGWLSLLTDLNTAKTYVRERIAQYFVDLMGIGISGLRVDALKHIGPDDFAAIMGLFSTYMGGSLPDDFIEWGEVGIGGEADLLACNADSGYNFYEGMDSLFTSNGISSTDISKLKIWSSDYPTNMPVCGSWILPAARFVIQNDDHDQQFDSSARPMGTKGSILVTAKHVDTHRSFEVKLFNRTDADWQIKVVLSSYTLFDNGAAGFPDGLSDCDGATDTTSCTLTMPYEQAFQAGSCGYTVENFAGGKYTRVHRDLEIVNSMRTWVGLSSASYSDLGIAQDC